MIKKKLMALVVAAALTLATAGCSASAVTTSTGVSASNTVSTDSSSDKTSVSLSVSSASVSASTSTSASTSASASAGSTSASTKDTDEGDTKVYERTKVFDMFSEMTVGWNLGNTMDAFGAGNSLRSETYWGNPKTEKALFEFLKNNGFNTVRIPVTWAEHTGKAPDYTINSEWMGRVREIVDYAMDLDMFVILNTHHETEYWLKTDVKNKDAVKEELTAIWAQIAETFKDYGDKLIFEGMNEPRLRGSAKEWSGGTVDERQMINELNMAFVDTVRESGGNNAERVLILCTYGHSADAQAIKDLQIPKDDNIAVAVHMYTPYFFTYVADGSYSNWDGSHKQEIADAVKSVKKYLLDNNVPVIITETGTQFKENTADIVKWIDDYFGIMDENGIKCVIWDNGIFRASGENFGVVDRRALSFYDETIARAYTDRYKK